MSALAFLFALSLTAPRSWEQVAHRSPLRTVHIGIRFRLPLTMPSLIVSDVTTATPEPRTAQVFTPPIEPQPPVVAPQPQPTPIQPTISQPSLSQPILARPSPTVSRAVTSPSVPASISVGPAPASDPAVPTLQSPRLSGGPRPSGSPAPHPAAPAVAASETVAPTAPRLHGSQPTLVPAIQPLPPPDQPEQVASRPVEPTLTTPTIEPIAAAPLEPSWWPTPVDLVARLDKLREHEATRPWADRTAGILESLARAGEPTSPDVMGLLDDLRTVAADPVVVDESRLEPQTAVELRLARHALLRRVDVWESLAQVLRGGGSVVDAVATDDPRNVELCLVELESQTAAAGETGRQWRSYLLVDSLRQTLKNGGPIERRNLAREVLARMRQASDQQGENHFLKEGPFARLDNLLRSWTETEVDPHRLLVGIERFEQGGLPSDGRQLAEESRLLQGSSNEAKQRLAVWLTSHYRNSNIRITVSDDLLNRLLPDALKQQTAVNDTILGLPTHGWSTARTGLSVRFLPSRDKLAVRLEAQGVVNSQTRTLSGSVRLFNHNNSTFAAHKDLIVSPDGVQAGRAVALSNANTKLRGVESDYDDVPILGGIVSSIAVDKHMEKKPAALREVAWKTARNVERNLDQDIEQHLTQCGTDWKERVLKPLEKLELQPEIIDLQTLEDRATIRLRIAGDDQLAANTPRPRAYSDNVGSLQLHQSAANNMIDRLGLQGGRFTPAQLHRHIIEALKLQDKSDPSKFPTDVEFQFAATDPLTLRFEDGKIELRLALDELKCGDRSWTNFVVRAQFKPEVIDGRTYLVRDGVIRLNGPQLRTTAQISLRTVCAKVFPDDLRVALWPDELLTDARFADLDIEQIDIRDGWLGASIGPRRTISTAATPIAAPTSR